MTIETPICDDLMDTPQEVADRLKEFLSDDQAVEIVTEIYQPLLITCRALERRLVKLESNQ